MDRRSAVTLLLVVSLLCGCKHAAPSNSSQSATSAGTSESVPKAAAAPAVDPATAGTIRGTIHFKGTPPPRVRIDMSMDPACTFGGENLTEQYLIKDGGLANVYVYIKSGLPASSAPGTAAPARVDQHGCRFVPHVVAVQQGNSVQFTNSDPAMHNVHTDTAAAGDDAIDVSQGPGAQPQIRRFNAPQQMIEIRCNNHPWMNGFVNVAPNPYFSVTNADGGFTIAGLPPGTYTLAAVHEKLGEQDVEVTVAAHQTASANVTYTMR